MVLGSRKHPRWPPLCPFSAEQLTSRVTTVPSHGNVLYSKRENVRTAREARQTAQNPPGKCSVSLDFSIWGKRAAGHQPSQASILGPGTLPRPHQSRPDPPTANRCPPACVCEAGAGPAEGSGPSTLFNDIRCRLRATSLSFFSCKILLRSDAGFTAKSRDCE